MKHQEISVRYQKWIIEYSSEKYLKPIYFVWVIDAFDNEKLLITKSRKIIAAKTKSALLNKILELQFRIPDSKRMKKWVNKSLELKKISTSKYNMKKVESRLTSNKLKPKDLSSMINFINLFEEYENQIGRKRKDLKSRTRNLDLLWNYYYDQILLPNFYDQKESEKKKFREYEIDTRQLLKDFRFIRKRFEGKIRFI